MRVTGLVLGLATLTPSTALLANDDPAVIAGGALFRDFCEVCHGETAQTGASGDIRGLGFGTVRIALRGIEAMPAFDLTDAEIEAIVAYLASLSGV